MNKRIKKINQEVEADVKVYLDEDDILEIVEMHKKGKKIKPFYVTQDIDVEVDIDFSTIIEALYDFNDSEIEELLDNIGYESKNHFDTNNLNDEMKLRLIKKIYNEYEIDEILSKFNMKYSDF